MAVRGLPIYPPHLRQAFPSSLVAHAAKLLRGREHSLLGVIFTCGFNDVSHFYRMFRRRYGAASGAWLNRGN